MQIRNSNERYGWPALSMHWLTAGLVVLAWSLGQGMDILPKGDARAAGIVVHISLGLAVLLVVTVRLAWRNISPPPSAVPSRFGRWSEKFASIVHVLLYALLFAVPIVGIAYWFAHGQDLPILGLAHIPSPFPANRSVADALIGVHAILANTIVILAGFHAAAALLHHYVLHDATLTRMLPPRGRGPSGPKPPLVRDMPKGPRVGPPATPRAVGSALK